VPCNSTNQSDDNDKNKSKHKQNNWLEEPK